MSDLVSADGWKLTHQGVGFSIFPAPKLSDGQPYPGGHTVVDVTPAMAQNRLRLYGPDNRGLGTS